VTLALGLVLLGALLIYAGIKGESVSALLLGNVTASQKPTPQTR
jgi:hypothetical protein